MTLIRDKHCVIKSPAGDVKKLTIVTGKQVKDITRGPKQNANANAHRVRMERDAFVE